MNELSVFNYGETPVRTIQKNNEVWWVLADVCGILSLTNTSMIANRLDDDEKAKFDLGLKNGNLVNCVNEPGLYSVILRSDKPEAKNFKRWVTHEVLPAIRNKGSYGSDDKIEVARLIASCKCASAVKVICAMYGIKSSEGANIALMVHDTVAEYIGTLTDWEITHVPAKKLYSDYKNFCCDNAYEPVVRSMFSRTIHSCGYVSVRRRVNGVQLGFYQSVS